MTPGKAAMIARPRLALKSLVTCLLLTGAGAPASAQRLDQQWGAWAGEMAARAAAAVLGGDELIVQAINRAGERDLAFDRLLALPAFCEPARDRCEAPNGERASWQTVIAGEAAKYLMMPEMIDGLWMAKKKLIVETINGLAPENRQRLLRTLDATMYAMAVYAANTDGIRQAFLDRCAAYDLWHKEAGLRARTVRDAQQRLADKIGSLAIQADRLELADRLWSAGGQPLFSALLRVGTSLREAIKSKEFRQLARAPY